MGQHRSKLQTKKYIKILNNYFKKCDYATMFNKAICANKNKTILKDPLHIVRYF